MTVASVAAPAGTSRVRGLGVWTRAGLFATIVLGPLSIAILRGILPYSDTDNAATIARKVAAHQTAQTAVLWLTLVGMITLVPGVIAVGRLASRHDRRLGTWGMVLAVAGFSCLGVIAAADFAALASVRSGADLASTTRLIHSLNGGPVVSVGTAVFVVGHVVGLILIGVALLRAGAMSSPAAWSLIISQPLHFVFAVVVPSNGLDAVGWVLGTIGFAAAALAVVAPAAPVDRRDAARA